jgi:hypothetical protein
MKEIIKTGQPMMISVTDEDVKEYLYDICETEHAGCNKACPVYDIMSKDGEKFDGECPYFKNGTAMLERLRKIKIIPNKQLRVWWSSALPIKNMEYYMVNSIKEARKRIKYLTSRNLQNKRCTDNVGGLEIFELEKGCENKGDWSEWECEECIEDIFKCECDKNDK